MNDDTLTRRVTAALNRSSGELPPRVQQRLTLARQAALARHRGNARHGLISALQPWIEFHPRALRASAVASVMVAAVVGGAWWWWQDPAADLADVDVQLLSDELPPHTYLDQHFQAWLERASDNS